MATLQLPEGMTVRKVGNTLKVVPMRRRKVAIVLEKKAMPKKIEVSIHPFGSSREQLWIGKMIDGVFSKEKLLYKAVQSGEISAKKSYDGKFGKPSTSEDWEIIIPDDFQGALAKSRLSDATFKSRTTEWEVICG